MGASKLVQEMKQDSSKWLKTKGLPYADFSWQNGYGCFSVGQSQLNRLRKYIANQREHHRRVTYQDEFRQICQRYGIQIDERFVWD